MAWAWVRACTNEREGGGGDGQIERKFCSTFDVEQYHFHRTHLVNAVLWRLDLVEQFANALVCSCAAEWIHRTIIRSHTVTTQWQTPKQNVLRMFKAINFQCVQKEEWKKMWTTAAAPHKTNEKKKKEKPKEGKKNSRKKKSNEIKDGMEQAQEIEKQYRTWITTAVKLSKEQRRSLNFNMNANNVFYKIIGRNVW